MNERGFFTVVGLCLLLVISLSIRAIQDTEKNFSYLATDFQAEFELQNAAESGLNEAVKIIQNNPDVVPDKPKMYANRRERQYKISVNQPANTERLKNISAEVYGERADIFQGTRDYFSSEKFTDRLNKDASGKEISKAGVVLISVASGEDIQGMKKFRRALAYVLEEDGYEKIYYMSTLGAGE